MKPSPTTPVQPHRRGRCVHFNGVQNKKCEAGVAYDGLEKNGHRLPCLIEQSRQEKVDGKYVRLWKPWPDERPAASCEHLRAPTAEEIAAADAELAESMARMCVVMAVVSKWRTWTKQHRVAKQEVIECPACKGRLHLSQAAYNGHVWGQCETEGCVSWME
jgi:hypothetical protein